MKSSQHTKKKGRKPRKKPKLCTQTRSHTLTQNWAADFFGLGVNNALEPFFFFKLFESICIDYINIYKRESSPVKTFSKKQNKDAKTDTKINAKDKRTLKFENSITYENCKKREKLKCSLQYACYFFLSQKR